MDEPLVRGRPFVPGSQIKGVLRHHCERLAATLGCEVVDPHATGEDQQLALVAHFQPLERSGLIIDRLFGSRYQGDCLFVDDARPIGDAATESDCDLRTRVALDRVTGTALEGHLFITEVARGELPLTGEQVNGPHLGGWIRARHPASVLTPYDGGFPYEYALLIAALLSLEALGGDKSAGLGRCRLELAGERLLWNDRPVGIPEALASLRELEADWKDFLDDTRGGVQA